MREARPPQSRAACPDFAAEIVATTGALIVVLDRWGRIIAFNPACERLTGYRFAEVRGQPFWDRFLLDDESARVRTIFADICSGRFPNTHENHWRTRDGGQRLIAWTNTARTDTAGRVEYIVASGIDVTERRAAEADARTRAAQLALLMAQLPAYLWTTDRELRLTAFHGGGFAGRDAEIAARVGLTLREFFRTDDPASPPIAAHRRALAGELATYDIRVAGRDHEVRVEPWRDATGTIIGTLGMGVDVTAQQATEASAAHFRTVFEQATLGIVLADLDRHILACNPAYERMMGYSEAELRLGTFPLATHPDDAARDMLLFHELIAGKRAAYGLEKRYIRKDGRIVQGYLVASLVRDVFNRPHQTIGMIEDITAQRVAEAGLTEAQHQLALAQELATRQERELARLHTGLSAREFEVVRLIAQRRTNARIVARLAVEVATVKTHIRHINEKLGTANRHEIAALAWERGWAQVMSK